MLKSSSQTRTTLNTKPFLTYHPHHTLDISIHSKSKSLRNTDPTHPFNLLHNNKLINHHIIHKSKRPDSTKTFSKTYSRDISTTPRFIQHKQEAFWFYRQSHI